MLTVSHARRSFMVVMLIAPMLATAQAKPTLALAREHVGDDCVNGVLTIDRDFIAYMIATRYQQNRPRLASLLPGTFDAQLSGSAATGWEIAYQPETGDTAVHLQLWREPVAGAGGIAIGDKLASSCRFAPDSEYAIAARAFEQRLKRFQPGTGGRIDIRLKIEDR